MFADKTILITGGTGSFGKAFSGELIEKYNFGKIIIFSRDEFKQDLMKKDFTAKYGAEAMKKFRFFIGDIRDKDRLKLALIKILDLWLARAVPGNGEKAGENRNGNDEQ